MDDFVDRLTIARDLFKPRINEPVQVRAVAYDPNENDDLVIFNINNFCDRKREWNDE